MNITDRRVEVLTLLVQTESLAIELLGPVESVSFVTQFNALRPRIKKAGAEKLQEFKDNITVLNVSLSEKLSKMHELNEELDLKNASVKRLKSVQPQLELLIRRQKVVDAEQAEINRELAIIDIMTAEPSQFI